MIYNSKEEAKAAVAKYIDEARNLRERLGVWEEGEDSCCDTAAKANYKDENGRIREYVYYYC